MRPPRLPWFVAFLARRLVWAVITMLVFVAVLLAVMEVWVPYSWATLQTARLPPSAEALTREQLGLDVPLPIRYAEFIGGLLRGDLGTSFGGTPVIDSIAGALPVTLTVFLVGAVLGWVVGEALGRIGSWSRSVVARSSSSTLAVASAATFPPFLVFVLVTTLREPMLASRDLLGLPRDSLVVWRDSTIGAENALMPADVWWVIGLSLTVAMIGGLVARALARRRGARLVALLAVPAALAGTVLGIWLSGLGPHALDLMYRANVPVTTHRPDMALTIGRGSPALAILGVALLTFGTVMLLMRASMDIQRTEEYVFTGRAKGLPDHLVRDRHAARNAIPPVLAGSFLTFPTVIAGMMIIEFEFQMQGLSSVLFDAVETQDIPLITGILVALGLIGVVLRVVTDVVIASLDPRRRRVQPIRRAHP